MRSGSDVTVCEVKLLPVETSAHNELVGNPAVQAAMLWQHDHDKSRYGYELDTTNPDSKLARYYQTGARSRNEKSEQTTAKKPT